MRDHIGSTISTKNLVIARLKGVSWDVGKALYTQVLLTFLTFNGLLKVHRGHGDLASEAIQVAKLHWYLRIFGKAPVGRMASGIPRPNFHLPALARYTLSKIPEVGTSTSWQGGALVSFCDFG